MIIFMMDSSAYDFLDKLIIWFVNILTGLILSDLKEIKNKIFYFLLKSSGVQVESSMKKVPQMYP